MVMRVPPSGLPTLGYTPVISENTSLNNKSYEQTEKHFYIVSNKYTHTALPGWVW